MRGSGPQSFVTCERELAWARGIEGGGGGGSHLWMCFNDCHSASSMRFLGVGPKEIFLHHFDRFRWRGNIGSVLNLLNPQAGGLEIFRRPRGRDRRCCSRHLEELMCLRLKEKNNEEGGWC